MNDQQVTFNVLEVMKNPDGVEDCNFLSVVDSIATERIDNYCSKEEIRAATFDLKKRMLQQPRYNMVRRKAICKT